MLGPSALHLVADSVELPSLGGHDVRKATRERVKLGQVVGSFIHGLLSSGQPVLYSLLVHVAEQEQPACAPGCFGMKRGSAELAG